jgi:hypothetical protein
MLQERIGDMMQVTMTTVGLIALTLLPLALLVYIVHQLPAALEQLRREFKR